MGGPLLLGVWIAALAYGWWFTDLEPFSDAAFRALLIPVGVLIVVATVTALVTRQPRARRQPAPRLNSVPPPSRGARS